MLICVNKEEIEIMDLWFLNQIKGAWPLLI